MQTILLPELLKRFEGQFDFDYSRVPYVRWQNLEITENSDASTILSNSPWKLFHKDMQHEETQVIYEILEATNIGGFSPPARSKNTAIRFPALSSDDKGRKIQLKSYAYFVGDRILGFSAEALTETEESIHVILTEPIPKNLRVGSGDNSHDPGKYSFGFIIYEHFPVPH